ncbi:hypothetical protein ACNOYE_30710 [Nannocystaceae bacterium ST9]
MRTSPTVFFVLTIALGLTGSWNAHATTYRDLCSSVPGECEYTGPDAPVLGVNVCWSRSTSTSTLMTGATCPTGGWPYTVKYGLVDPLSGVVTGFVPLDDACSRPGLCSPGYLAPPNTWTSAAMCCIDGVCWPWEFVGGCAGEVLFCANGASNEDGTVECFDEQTA